MKLRSSICAVLRALVAVIAVRGAAFAQTPNSRELLVLSQLCPNGITCYFVDASHGQLSILAPEPLYDKYYEKIGAKPARSNIVISASPGWRDVWQDSGGEREQFHPPSMDFAKSGLETWMDRKGHVHTKAVLQQQLDYNFRLLSRWRADCATARCSIHLVGAGDIVLTPVMATGILDRTTMVTPLRLLQLDLHSLRMELTVRCQQETRKPCNVDGEMPLLSLEHWRALLAEGLTALADYESELAKVPFEIPKAPSAILYNRVFPENPYEGLPGMDVRLVPKTLDSQHPILGTTEEYFRQNKVFNIRVDDSAPENRVLESASLGAMTPSRLETLKALHRNVEAKIAATRRFADGLYPEAVQ